MNIEQRMYDLERRYRKLQFALWSTVVIVACAFTLGMTQQVTLGGFAYPNTIHRVELVHTRDNMGEIGWVRGGKLDVGIESNFISSLRSRPLKVNLTNSSGISIK